MKLPRRLPNVERESLSLIASSLDPDKVSKPPIASTILHTA